MSKILTLNLFIIILGIFLFCILDLSGRGGGIISMVLSVLLIGAQALINLIIGIICLTMRNKDAKYFFLSMILVVLIGVPLCFGGVYVAS